MTDIFHVSWPFRPDPRKQATIPRYATCLDEESADEVAAGLVKLGYPQTVVYAVEATP